MFYLNKLQLTQYKNYNYQSFTFSKKVVGICGLNGQGKTNLLDAIYYCCFTKSYFTTTDYLNAQFNTDGFRIEAHFTNHQLPLKIVCINKTAGKKDFLQNDIPYEKLSAHIGSIPAVIIAPDDVDIIIGGSEGRRRYLDTIICQLDKDYLHQLILYNKILIQRNSLLKQAAELGQIDKTLMEVLSTQLVNAGNIVFEKRLHFTEKLIPFITSFYKCIADNDEVIQFKYTSQLETATFNTLLQQTSTKEKILQRTMVGIHKDDVQFLLNDQPFKNIASQGQRKSLLFALKLAQYQLLKNHTAGYPLLMLDDVFEKLDEKRIKRLLTWVCVDNDGQVFITDTHKTRLIAIFEQLQIDGQIIEL